LCTVFRFGEILVSDSQQKIDSGATASNELDWDVESVVDQIWGDLGGTVTRPAIRRELAQVILAFSDARVKTYVPIFVRRQTVERLRSGHQGGPAREALVRT
jgi:hypothetical protein